MILCTNCEKLVKPIKKTTNKIFTIHGIKIEVQLEESYCNECDECLYDENIEEKNNKIIKDKYFEITKTINNNEIKKQILERYNISAKNLAKLLGWGEVTIQRYVSGALPSIEYGQILTALTNPLKFEKLLYDKKDILTSNAFIKSLHAVNSALESLSKEKGFETIKAIDVVKYFIKEQDLTDIYTPKLWFMKIIAFAQGWHMHFFDIPLYKEDALAWKLGPVIYDVLSRNNYWDSETYSPTSKLVKDSTESNIYLNQEQKKLLDLIFESYGCYQPPKLVNISHDSLYYKYYDGTNSFDNVMPKWAIKENYDKLGDVARMKSIEELPNKIEELVRLAR